MWAVKVVESGFVNGEGACVVYFIFDLISTNVFSCAKCGGPRREASFSLSRSGFVSFVVP